MSVWSAREGRERLSERTLGGGIGSTGSTDSVTRYVGPTLSLDELVESYRQYLMLHQASNPGTLALKRFDDRLAACREAAQTECVTFEYLRSRNLNPHLLEDPISGGVDFECQYGKTSFAVEATALQDETLTERSGVDNETVGAGYVDMPEVVSLLRSRISKKAGQASRYAGPRVLAIGATHIAGSMLFSVGVEELLTGESKIVVPVGPRGATGDHYMATDLRNAAALRAVDGTLQVFRRKYALVLFLAIHGRGCHVQGLLHPEPEYSLDVSAFPHLPFARLKWPIVDNTLRIEWIIADPAPEQHVFFPVQITTEELKGGIK